MSSLNQLTPAQLRKAASLKETIAKLEKQLAEVLGVSAATSSAKATAKPKRKGMSAAGRARIIAAQKARWAKFKAAKK